MVKPHWYNEGMRDAFCVALHVTDFDAIGYWALTVWELFSSVISIQLYFGLVKLVLSLVSYSIVSLFQFLL